MEATLERWEIEAKLNRDRAWLLETYAALSADDLFRPCTPSEHDPATMWSAADHLAHLAGIEGSFTRMIRDFLGGSRDPIAFYKNADGSARTAEQAMAAVHEMTEAWVRQHRGKPFSAIVALGQEARAETLALLASLTGEQLALKLPEAPWADGSIGGVLAVNADHGRMHYRWVKEGWESSRDA
ncbi:MAG: DinB family protein [Chloroflexi bacterium CFX7]|nr:DinB family protein [Chloroflexi bacterium CFX7]RIL03211.1 MAG: hypothetical protein DCC78_04060 [bacterium]